MSRRSRTTAGRIVVVGDVALDWLEEAVPRSELGGGDTPRNYEFQAGFHWTPVWGGAALLERLLKSALKARQRRGKDYRFDGVSKRLPRPSASGARKYLQSLAVVRQFVGESAKPTRVDSFKGFAPKAVPRTLVASCPSDSDLLSCVVVDDAANGCRDDSAFVERLRRLIAESPLLVVKLSRPLDRSVLVQTLVAEESHPATRVVTVVNADDLRAQGVDISRRLSWERSVVDLVSVCDGSPILSDLATIGDVLVRFGNEGCIALQRAADRFLVFDPRRVEDAFDQELSGTMPGATSAFTAEIAASLLENVPLRHAIPRAMCAARALLRAGFSRSGKTKQVEDYPLDVFTHDATEVAVFVVIDLPPKDENLRSWSILSTKLKSSDRQIGEMIVREGHEAHLTDVPIAQFGRLLLADNREIEGYRSIENLLREYIKSRQGGKPKPLSIGVFGPPGSGKSFGIKEIGKCLRDARITFWPYNLTQLEGPRDLVGAFHVARDEALRGNLPLLIFDEFDCAFDGRDWGWLKYFLAPMQDAEFEDDGQIHPLGHAVFVFAGGIAQSYDRFKAPSDNDDFKAAKGPDFVSRLKGFVDVQGINPTGTEDVKDEDLPDVDVDPVSVIRRAILLRSLLLEQEHRTRNMYPIVNGRHCFDIDDAVLDALLRVKKYRHGARSLESILMMSRLTDRDHFGVASLPSDAQLKLHVDDSFSTILKKYSKNR
jgi:hypothetical protein